MAIEEHNGEVDVKTAYIKGFDSFAIKISPGFFDNPKIGLPSTSGLMILLSAKTGMVEALFLDNGYLTDIRTAAAGAVAARHLARKNASSACIIGAGTQARLQLQALALVRPINRATLWARDTDKAEAAANQMSEQLGFAVTVANDPETAVANADIVVTTTPATAPVLMAGWMRRGQHITAMGSDQHGKNELHPACLTHADLYVPDRLSQARELGELRTAVASGMIDKDARFAELGDIVSGKAHGRMSETAITIADLTGTGVQDTAIANFARLRVEEVKAGTEFSNRNQDSPKNKSRNKRKH
jgi:ectoine utilization protein EutC